MNKELTPLEALKYLTCIPLQRDYKRRQSNWSSTPNDYKNIIENALKRLETIETAYNEIPISLVDMGVLVVAIKKKNANIQLLRQYWANYDDETSFKLYNQNHKRQEQLTEIEFETLKRVLK